MKSNPPDSAVFNSGREEENVPEHIARLHHKTVELAIQALAMGPHPPIVLFDPLTENSMLVDLAQCFGDGRQKEHAANALRQIAREHESKIAIFVVEAVEGMNPPGCGIPQSAEDCEISRDILSITIEEPGSIYSWSHPMETQEGGAHTIQQQARFYVVKADDYSRFRLLPANQQVEN